MVQINRPKRLSNLFAQISERPVKPSSFSTSTCVFLVQVNLQRRSLDKFVDLSSLRRDRDLLVVVAAFVLLVGCRPQPASTFRRGE